MVTEWLWTGAPAGILHDPDVGPVFPQHDEDDPEPPFLLKTDFEEFKNYGGADEEELVATELD